MNTDLLFSHKTDNWSTPKWLFDELDSEFHFDMDPCPLRSLTDGLDKSWLGNIFVNPPYSNIKAFLEKSWEERDKGNAKTVVFLLASRTDTKWFHEYIYHNPSCEIRFIKGRLKFGDNKNSAPFPSMIVIFRNN